jgi:hypothetical protein
VPVGDSRVAKAVAVGFGRDDSDIAAYEIMRN